MARMKRRGDIDSTYNALRPRLGSIGGGTSGGSTTIPAHTHSADQIGMEENVTRGGYLAADDVQEGLEELDSEKLARSGDQVMLGPLDMDSYDINNINDADIEGNAVVGINITMTGALGTADLTGVRDIEMVGAAGEGNINGVRNISMVNSVIGEGIVDSPRVIHMAGDYAANTEALIDGVERIAFNNEVTESAITLVSRIEYNPAVTADVDYTAAQGISSWDDEEGTLVVWVLSGPGGAPV